MRKINKVLLLSAGLLFAGIAMGQAPTHSSTTLLSEQKGVKVFVHNSPNAAGTGTTTSLEFFNTGKENVSFDWVIKNKEGKVIYSNVIKSLTPGKITSFPQQDSVLGNEMSDSLSKALQEPGNTIEIK